MWLFEIIVDLLMLLPANKKELTFWFVILIVIVLFIVLGYFSKGT